MMGTVGERVRATKRVYSGRVLSLDVDEVEEPGHILATREVVRHQGSVAALPVHADGSVVLIRQYRYASDQTMWEVPAGRLEPHEDPAEGVLRELEEEVGLKAATLEAWTAAYTTPGFSDEVVHLFRASGLQAIPPRPEADELIEIRVMPFEDARELARKGEIRDAKTLLALLFEGERRREGK
jgi:ADP-ribose pyrophosphatase